jgi:hypothetical protein
MTVRIAVALYRCEVAGTPTDELDVQIRHFDDSTPDIESCVQSEPPYSYSNDQGESVTWFFVRVICKPACNIDQVRGVTGVQN